MGLRTVRVPEAMEGPFAAVESLVERYFKDRIDDPAHGTIEIAGERYVLVRAASLSVEFFSLVRDLYGEGRRAEADTFARNILFDLAHAVGKSDAQAFHQKMGLVDPIARLSAGPIHFAHAGWAFVDISPDSRPSPDEDYYLLYEHPYSFEADAWLRARAKGAPESAVCIMNAGYSSGWCEESFGLTLVAAEIACRAAGDDACRFIMAHPSRIEGFIERYLAGRPHRPERPRHPIPDFFARKRIEEELVHARDDLERRVADRTAALTLSNERLREEIAERRLVEKKLLQRHKLEAIGRLAGGIAHDFNNLMAVILGNCSLLDRRIPEGESLRTFVSEIREAGERAAGLTQQLLAFGRANVRSREVIPLNRIVEDLSRMLDRLIGDDVQLTVELGPDVGAIEGDRGQIEQVLVNLVVNARDAMPTGGALRVTTQAVTLDDHRARILGDIPAGSYALLTVEDEGVGMDDETMSQIFDPFFTTKQATVAGTSGSGLGLSTVYGIVRQSGGAIGVISAPGQGAKFQVYLPRIAQPTANRSADAQAMTEPTGSETILLVEDQPQLRQALSQVLADLGYRVLQAASGLEALQLVSAHAGRIHLLLTDVVMPRMSGIELAATLLGRDPATAVLYMSGFSNDPLLATSGAQYIQKPFEPAELARRLRRLLERH
jgi:two-component system cell cycle sensor histidine kinase/response regulator CckA